MNKNEEILLLANEILKNIELSELSLSGIVTKTLRLARLLGDSSAMDWLKLELSGYTSTPSGIPQNEFLIGAKSKRYYIQNDKSGVAKTYMVYDSVGKIEADLEAAKAQLQVSSDPNTSVSSSNPYQTVMSPMGNQFERAGLRMKIAESAKNLEKIKVSIYEYVLNTYYEFRFAEISESIFERTRKRVDASLAKICPKGVEELVSAYQNLLSKNASDWSNGANSCRRLIKDLADTLYPAGSKDITEDGHKITDSEYKNRLIEYVKNQSENEKFIQIVGSQLKFLTDRLDAIYDISSKGVHADITKEEAERLVIYTYLLAGDILTIVPEGKKGIQKMIDEIHQDDTVEVKNQQTLNADTIEIKKEKSSKKPSKSS